jgi:hypothetical protein
VSRNIGDRGNDDPDDDPYDGEKRPSVPKHRRWSMPSGHHQQTGRCASSATSRPVSRPGKANEQEALTKHTTPRRSLKKRVSGAFIKVPLIANFSGSIRGHRTGSNGAGAETVMAPAGPLWESQRDVENKAETAPLVPKEEVTVPAPFWLNQAV